MAELKRSLGYATIVALSVTSMVGTGMFLGQGIASEISGNMSLISWGILSLISIYVAMCFGELASLFPNAGGVYEFAKQSYGRFFSFLIGWVTWLVGNITTAVVIVAAINYVVPSDYTLPFLPHLSTDLIKILFAVVFILLLNYVAYRGVEASAKVLIAFAAITIAVVLLLLIPGFTHVSASNFHPFWQDTSVIENWRLILLTLFFIMETYFGWEAATFLAEETKDPEQVIPRGILITTIIVSALGFLFAVVLLGSFPFLQGQPLHELSNMIYGPQAWLGIKALVFIALLGSAAGGIVANPRLILALSRDKLFLNSLAQVHERFQTPHKAIMFQTIITIIIVIIGFGEYAMLLSMLVPLALIMYVAVLIAVPILRMKLPHITRLFKVPFGTVGPLIVSGFFISIIAAWLYSSPTSIETFKLLLSFVFFGVPIYLLLMFYYDPDVIVRLNDFFAYFTLAFERVLIPRKIEKHIFTHIQDIQGKTVLEFGCGVGTVTRELAAKAGPTGIIYATDVSYTSVKIANRRIARRGHINVRFIHDIHQVNRVHHSIPNVDIIVSVGMLGYLQDIKKVLKEMNALMPEGGKIIFVDYVDLFKVIPNVSWLSHREELIELFRECGFSVKVEKIKGLLWNYMFISGIKSEHDVPYV
jgi:basic amino acid/polyamine antiporter, APA family